MITTSITTKTRRHHAMSRSSRPTEPSTTFSKSSPNEHRPKDIYKYGTAQRMELMEAHVIDAHRTWLPNAAVIVESYLFRFIYL